MASREQIDEWWGLYVGSRELSAEEELDILTKMRRQGEVPLKRLFLMYLTSKWWREFRQKRLAMDGFACVTCKSKVKLHVDHLKYRKFGGESLEDVQTLCYYCHGLKTRKYDVLAGNDVAKRGVFLRPQLFEMLRRSQ